MSGWVCHGILGRRPLGIPCIFGKAHQHGASLSRASSRTSDHGMATWRNARSIATSCACSRSASMALSCCWIWRARDAKCCSATTRACITRTVSGDVFRGAPRCAESKYWLTDCPSLWAAAVMSTRSAGVTYKASQRVRMSSGALRGRAMSKGSSSGRSFTPVVRGVLLQGGRSELHKHVFLLHLGASKLHWPCTSTAQLCIGSTLQTHGWATSPHGRCTLPNPLGVAPQCAQSKGDSRKYKITYYQCFARFVVWKRGCLWHYIGGMHPRNADG